MYTIYVIELRKEVFSENRKFREANPQYNGVNECLYVGMTSQSPQSRFEQHKQRKMSQKGFDISSSIVAKYGSFLRPSLYNNLPQYTKRDDALKAEKELAATLRRQRYAVWVN